MITHNWLIQKLNTVDSTQLYAKSFLLQNKQIVIVANSQTGGYGQYNRQWFSPIGNLYTSLIIPIVGVIDSKLSYLVVVALGETMLSFASNCKLQYKWVNDILINRQKVCGILCEIVNNHYIIGIGLNLKQHPKRHQLELSSTSALGATSLKLHGIDITPEVFIQTFLPIFTNLYNKQDFNFIRALWKSRAYKLHEHIIVNNIHTSVSGVFYDLDTSGRLLIQSTAGIIKIQKGNI